jgi:hypothetical protein
VLPQPTTSSTPSTAHAEGPVGGPRPNASDRRTPAAEHLDWLLWQLADSALPTGGFAHSGGLEAACSSTLVQTPDDLERFLRTSVFQVGRTLPFVLAARSAPDNFPRLDLLFDKPSCSTTSPIGLAERSVTLSSRRWRRPSKRVEAVRACRGLRKSDLRWNSATPAIAVDPETYMVTADGEVLTCLPAARVALARRYFLF